MSRRTLLGFEPRKNTRGTTDPETARAIFSASGRVRDIARRYGVSPQVVYDIRAGRTWGYATGLDGRVVRTGSAGRYDDPVRGTVILYSQMGGKIAERRYIGAGGRAKVLENFRESLGAERFQRLVVAFRPDLKDASVEAVDLEHPEAVTFGLRAQRFPEDVEWEALKEKLGLDGEKCGSACENGSEMPAIARETAAPARGTFFSTQPPQSVAMSEIDAKIDSLEKVA